MALNRRSLLAAAFATVAFALPLSAQDRSIVVASTTSTEQSGLFGHILPTFTKKTGIAVKVVALGTGQALDVGWPYGNQREYTSGGIADWDGLMRGVFARLPIAEDGQVLVNLGLIHRDNEFIPYWDAWLEWMRTQGWRRFAWYVWDQGPGMPGDWAGRFAPSFEFVFHFNRQSRKPNKIVPCKHAGQDSHLRADGSSTAMRSKAGEVGGWTHAGQPTQETRIPDSVIRASATKARSARTWCLQQQWAECDHRSKDVRF